MLWRSFTFEENLKSITLKSFLIGVLKCVPVFIYKKKCTCILNIYKSKILLYTIQPDWGFFKSLKQSHFFVYIADGMHFFLYDNVISNFNVFFESDSLIYHLSCASFD